MSYLGIDVGTYQTKGVVVDRDGRVLAEAARDHDMLVPEPGWAEHDPEGVWWGDVVAVTRDLLAEVGPATIRAVAPSAIGPCLLAVDERGDPIGPGILYGVDTRATAEVEELTQRIGADTILRRCGNALTSQSTGPKLLWLKRHMPDVFERAACFHTATSFVVERLTGARVMDHYTAPNLAPLYDADARAFSDALAPDIVDLARLPRLLWSTQIAGRTTARAAAATGLPEGTPVLAGTIDAAAEAVSVGVLAPGQMMVMMGSTIFIIMPTEARAADERLWYAPWLFEGQHAALAGLATSGTLTHWLRERMMPEMDRAAAFGTMAREAEASPPGANGLVVLPYFSGERTPIHDPHAKGTIFGLDLTHTRGDIIRATLEGVALGTAHAIEAFGEAGAPPRELVAVGGGTRNAVWLQATGDATGLSLTIRRRTTGAAFGDALLAAIALGEAQPADIDRWNPVERVVEPRAEHIALYGERLDVFKALYRQTRDLMRRLN